MREYFRGNLWPNTPDILPLHLQEGGRPAFMHSRGPGRDALERLRHLQRIRVMRERSASRPRRVSRLGKISVEGARLERAGKHQGLITRLNRIRQREPRAAFLRQPAVLPRRKRRDSLLRQDDAGARQHHPRRRQFGSAPHAKLLT